VHVDVEPSGKQNLFQTKRKGPQIHVSFVKGKKKKKKARYGNGGENAKNPLQINRRRPPDTSLRAATEPSR